jgi:type VI secretion system protein ImpG
MNKDFLKYYNDEYNYLVEAGKEFAENQPERAGYLQIKSAQRDPYVERLFEGFAFLTARIRKRLETELSEFTEGIMELLWPHFLRPIPSLAILRFAPKEGVLREPATISAGTEVMSDVCKFRTCWNVRVLPVQLQKVSRSRTKEGQDVIAFRFRMDKGAKYEKIFAPAAKQKSNAPPGDDRIRLFVHSDRLFTASALLLFLTHYVEKTVIKPAAPNAPSYEMPDNEGVIPAGFAKDENLWPDSPNTLAGYRLLQEYFVFPEKFRFIDLLGLNRFAAPAEMDAFEIQVFLSRNLPDDLRFSEQNFDLFCTPIINLTTEEIRPITLDHLRPEYAVVPRARPEHTEVYAIESVTGIEAKTRVKHIYLPFHSFRHVSQNGQGPKQQRFFKAFSRFDEKKRWKTTLAFRGHDLQNGPLTPETISMTATCMNGALPNEDKRTKSICNPSKDFKLDVPFYNLDRPTPPIYPPPASAGEAGLQWQLLSHMALNFTSLSDINVLKEMLDLYNWPRDENSHAANRKRIHGIREVVVEPDQDVVNRAVVRGAKITLRLHEDDFNHDKGDLYLFGLVLNEALAHFATINSFTRLIVVAEPSGEEFKWSSKLRMGIPTI